MIKYKYYIITAISCLLIGRYILQPKQESKEVIKYVKVEVKKEKKKVSTKITERKNPDGSISKETSIIEDSSNDTISEDMFFSDKSFKTKTNVFIGIQAIKNVNSFSKNTEFGIVTSVPLIGNLSIIGSADTTKNVGIGLGISF